MHEPGRPLLVVAGDELVGILQAGDFVLDPREGETVGQRMRRPLLVVEPNVPLWKAQAQMDRLGVEWAPVVYLGDLVGLLLRDELPADDEAAGGPPLSPPHAV
jgi:CBS domain-containing protein